MPSNLFFRNDFEGAGYPSFSTPWPEFSFPTGNSTAFSVPCVDGHGNGIANRFVRLNWRGKCDHNPGTDYKVDARFTWENAGGARRGVGLIVRYVDFNNMIVARLESMITDSPRLRLFKIVNGVETQIGTTYTGSPIAATHLNEGVVVRVRVADLADGTGETSVKVFIDPPEDLTGDGTLVISWTGEIPETRGAYGPGIELDNHCIGTDVRVDYIQAVDFADEATLSGVSIADGDGWQVELGGILYEIGDDDGGGYLEGLSPPVSFEGLTVAYGVSGGGTEARFRVVGDYRLSLLRPGMRVRIFHNGTILFDGKMNAGSRSASETDESQSWTARSALWGAANIQIEGDDCTSSIAFNQPVDNESLYDADRAEKSLGYIIAFILDRYIERLREEGAAPEDGGIAYVQAELDALTAIVPGITVGGSVVAALQSLLQFAPQFQIKWDPEDRKFHFVDITALTAETIELTTEPSTLQIQDEPDQAYTAVVLLGSAPESDDDVSITLQDKAWTAAQEASTNPDKAHKSIIRLTVASAGTGAAGDPGTVFVDVAASEGLEEDDWRGSIANVEGDAFPRFVVKNTSTRIWMAAPLWPGNTPPSPGSYITLSLLHPQALAAISAQGVGQAYFLGSIVTIDGETDCNYGVNWSGLAAKGFCGTATVSKDGQSGAKYSQKYDYNIIHPSEMAREAGFCQPLAKLAAKPKPPIGLVNFMGDGSSVQITPPYGGGTSDSISATGGVPSSCSGETASPYAGMSVSIQVPKDQTCAPRLRVPTTGWYGPAYSTDETTWSGGGSPAPEDWGVRRELVIQLPDFTSSDQSADLEAAAQAILEWVSMRSINITVSSATPWRAFRDGLTSRSPYGPTTWSSLDKKLRISSNKRTTGYEGADDAIVYAVDFDIPGNRTTLHAGTAASWTGGNYGVLAEQISARQAALIAAKKIKTLVDQMNCVMSKDKSAVGGQQGGVIDGCTVSVSDSNTKKVTTITKKAEQEQENINALGLRGMVGDLINQAAQPTHPGAPVEVPGLNSEVVNPRIPYMGPIDVPNANRSRYGGLTGQDSPDAGRPPNVLTKFGRYAIVGKPNVNDSGGGWVGAQLYELDAHGNLQGSPVDFNSALDFPEGMAPLSALGQGSIQSQLRDRENALASILGAVQDPNGKILSAGDETAVYPDGAPSNLASILRTSGFLHFDLVPGTWNDVGGPIWTGPRIEGHLEPNLFWRIAVPENILTLVDNVGGGAGPNGSNWVDSRGGASDKGDAVYYASSVQIIHKNFSGIQLDWDKRYAPADAMAPTNPMGFESEEMWRLNGVDSGQPSGVGTTLDLPPGVRAWAFTMQVAEDADGVAVSAGQTYAMRFDYATRSSPWTGVSSGSIQTALAGSGSNDATAVYKAPGGSVPPGLRAPSGLVVSGVYVPGTGTAPSGATVGVLGLGVDLAKVDGGWLLRVKRRVDASTSVSNNSPWVSDLVDIEISPELEFTKNLESSVEIYCDVDLQLNPPLYVAAGVEVGVEVELSLNP